MLYFQYYDHFQRTQFTSSELTPSKHHQNHYCLAYYPKHFAIKIFSFLSRTNRVRLLLLIDHIAVVTDLISYNFSSL